MSFARINQIWRDQRGTLIAFAAVLLLVGRKLLQVMDRGPESLRRESR